MQGYFVRIDAREGYLDKIAGLQCVSDYNMIIAVRHNGHSKENPHYHIVIKTVIKDQAIRVRLRKIFDQGKGNAHMSIKAWDGDIHAVSYLFHEDEFADIVLRHNVDDEYLKQAKEINKEIQVAVQESKKKASYLLEEDAYQIYKNKSYPFGGFTDEDIATDIILMALRQNRYVPQAWLLRAMVTKIQFRLRQGDTEAEEHFARGLARNIFFR